MPRRPIDIPVPDLTGRRALVTGGSDGIGLALATRLAGAGAEVLLPVRDRRKGDAAVARIRERPGWDAIPAVAAGRIHEIKSPLILQPGPAALTDGFDAIRAALAGGQAAAGDKGGPT